MAFSLMLAQDLAGAALDSSTVSRMVGKGSEHLVKSVLNHVFAQSGRAYAAIDLVANYDRAQARCQQRRAGGFVDSLAELPDRR